MFLVLLALAVCLVFHPAPAHAAGYTREAELKDCSAYPGVYYVKAVPGDSGATIGIPSLDKNTLNAPTTESPAIIMGAAVPYEVKTGPTEFTQIAGGALYPPYSYFRYSIINEQGPDGSWHRKMSGFDGSYVLIRVDVSDLIKDAPAGSYLHVKQEGNKALMPLLRYEKFDAAVGKGSFSEALGNMSAVYAIDNGAVSMKDKEGNDTSTPYVDLIVYSSGTLVAGADTGSTAPGAQSADFALKFYIDKTPDYNPSLDYDPNNQSTTTPTHAEQVMAKFYDESKASGAQVTSYTIKGNDLEIEIMNDDNAPREFWSLRKAIGWYNNSPIKMICEVPVLEGLLIDGGRYVIFDVNSFDIQISNHQQTGAAALTVRNGTLKVMDSFNTTGAELAVGNNARMSIEAGGTLIIDETCQVEVEYDAASVAPTDGSSTAPDYDVGLITIADGGEVINNGVISIEGTEGKPVDPANPVIRDIKAAELHIEAGGRLTNNGCLIAYGGLYNLGTLENNGYYNDTITSNDPDKGRFTYHGGIQVAWKDDVTQDGVRMGYFFNGEEQNTNAVFINNGDLVLVPGLLDNYGTLENAAGGNMYLCAVDEAVIPYQASWSTLILEQRIGFEHPVSISVTNHRGATMNNAGSIIAAQAEIVANGQTGILTFPAEAEKMVYVVLDNFGLLTNSGSIDLDGIYTFGDMHNDGALARKVILEANQDGEGSLTDTAGFTQVYNAAFTESAGRNVWRHAACSEISVSPAVQYGVGGMTVPWTVHAKTADPDALFVRYFLQVYQSGDTEPVQSYTISANEDNTLQSPALPAVNGNVIYDVFLVDGLASVSARASVKVTSSYVTSPAPVKDLVYNGKEQSLITTGGASEGTMLYRLGESGAWSEAVPTAKDAGSYRIYYKLADDESTELAFVDAAIQKRPITISGNDTASQVGTALSELGWTVSGLPAEETLDGIEIAVSTNADKDHVGSYRVLVSVSGENPNYQLTVREGKYTVTADAFVVIAKDKYGVFSDEATYTGFNIDLTVPQGATAYYSTTTPLTAENYQTDGMTVLKNLPASAGTHTVYFYVTNGTSAVSGSKQVIIDKAAQAAPDPTKLTAVSETWRNSGDGQIQGLTARKMEYREKSGDGVYALAYADRVTVKPGTYLVRMAGDQNHYASPDAEITVAEGPTITVSFNVNGGTGSFPDATGLACGDRVPHPASVPTLQDAAFLGWFYGGKLWDFNAPVTQGMTLMAGWAPQSIDLRLPAGTTEIGEGAFEGTPVKSVEVPASCTWIKADAFKNCTGLKQIHILSADTRISPTAFEGCRNLTIFAPSNSLAEYLCTADNGFVFISDGK